MAGLVLRAAHEFGHSPGMQAHEIIPVATESGIGRVVPVGGIILALSEGENV
jgi:hypothetical protein